MTAEIDDLFADISQNPLYKGLENLTDERKTKIKTGAIAFQTYINAWYAAPERAGRSREIECTLTLAGKENEDLSLVLKLKFVEVDRPGETFRCMIPLVGEYLLSMYHYTRPARNCRENGQCICLWLDCPYKDKK